MATGNEERENNGAEQTVPQSDASSADERRKEDARDIYKRQPQEWRTKICSKRFFLAAVTTMLLLGLILGLSIGLTVGKKHKSENSAEPARYLGPVIDLGYIKYRGDSYPHGVSQWLGIRYAQPPVGDLRFAAPQPVQPNKTIQHAVERGHYCLGTRKNLIVKAFSGTAGEDCLNLDIYAPGNATSSSKLPVYFFMQGGGFNTAYPTANGSNLALHGNIVVVSINYRISAYGFLASEEIKAKGSLNNGLKDQRMALEWVQQHIEKFGGDPKHVVIGGVSAGAGSVTLQLAAYGGRQDNLFHGSIAESQSFGALRTVAESQYQYDDLVSRTKCDAATTGNNDTLSCLRKLDIVDLQNQNILTRFPDTHADPLFTYNPCLDMDFIQAYTLDLFNSGRYLKLPAIYGDVSNEGTTFVPKTATSTVEESNNFLQAQFPKLNSTQLDTIQKLYPPVDQSPSLYPKIGNAGKYWRSTADAYGDQRYVCPGFLMSNVSAHFNLPSKGNWNYHYNVTNPGDIARGFGVQHVAEQGAVWGNSGNPINKLMQAYWLSFIQTFDPNKLRAPGAPLWNDWGRDDSAGGNRLHIQNPDSNGGFGNTGMERVDPGYRDRCSKLLDWGVAIQQ